MTTKTNEIVTLVTHVGEIIGRVKAETEDYVVLSDPRLFVNQSEGAGLAPGICMTGQMNPTEATFFKGSIVAIVATAVELEKSWTQAVSGIALA